MKKYICLAALTLLCGDLLAQQADTDKLEDWTAINLSVTDEHVIPAYVRFAQVSADLPVLAASFCQSPASESLAAVRAGFHQSMDAWQSIQHIKFGPVTYFNWNFRLQYWPDDKNTGARQLDALIAAADPSALSGDTFARQSVGIQGFGALERLLFEEDALSLLQQDAYRCEVLQTIASNIGEIAAGISVRWQEEFRDTIASADTRELFESAQDATVEFYKAQVETLDLIQHQKVQAVLGESHATARERKAESWRSKRSIRNLKVNIATLQVLFDVGMPSLSSVLQEDDNVQIRAAFSSLQNSLSVLTDDYATLLQDEESYQKMKSVELQMDGLYELLETALKKTDLYLGFNSLDGD